MPVAKTLPEPKWAKRHSKNFDNLPPQDLVVEVLSHNSGKSRSVLIIAPLESFDCGKSGLLFKPQAEKEIRTAYKRARTSNLKAQSNPEIEKYCLLNYLKGKNKIQICDSVIEKFEKQMPRGKTFTERMAQNAIERAIEGKCFLGTDLQVSFKAVEIIADDFHITGRPWGPDLSADIFYPYKLSHFQKRRAWEISFNAMREIARENPAIKRRTDTWVWQGLNFIDRETGGQGNLNPDSVLPEKIEFSDCTLPAEAVMTALFLSATLLNTRF